MTKKHCLLGFGALALLFGLTLSSCKADEDDDPMNNSDLWSGTLADAPYANDAARYILKGEDAPYKSIELTGSGLYFVEYPNYSYDEPDYSDDYDYSDDEPDYSHRSFAARHNKKGATRYGWDTTPIKQGLFSVDENGYYILGAFGKIKWDESTQQLEIILDDNQKSIWDAVKEQPIQNNALNNRICRTWKITEAKIECCDLNGNVLSTYQLSKAEIEDEYIDYFTCTRAGRMYEMDDSEWIGYSWRWINPSLQVMRFIADNPEEDGSGDAQILFHDDKMSIMVPDLYEDIEEVENEYAHLISNVPSDTRIVREYMICTPYNPF